MATIERARAIAESAHAGQVDKAGADYFTHPLRVCDAVIGEDAKIVAFLHRVGVDSDWTRGGGRPGGFWGSVVAPRDPQK
ncbi:GTP pyrophosphokinase, partial [Aurantimonas coralicida]|nr:GTP pyrophosphokinase [Aurantimonas coralicida]